MNIHNYSKEKFPFINLVLKEFNVQALETLHVEYSKHMPDLKNLKWEEESSTFFHKKFYSKLNENGPYTWNEMIETYRSFVREEIKPRLPQNETFVKQRFPSFRVQLPDAKAIHKWHYDSDSDHRHPDGEINIQIPLTVMYDTSATWIESIPGLRDFSPMQMFPGQYVMFNGNKCMHGNKTNETGLTRVSLDFRIINKNSLEEQKTTLRSSATIGTKFAVGGYYEEI